MNILFAAIVLALICLLIIWLGPNWGALSAQLNAFFRAPPRASTDQANIKPVPPPRSHKHPPDDQPARPQTGQRHTVVPHQSRGR